MWVSGPGWPMCWGQGERPTAPLLCPGEFVNWIWWGVGNVGWVPQEAASEKGFTVRNASQGALVTNSCGRESRWQARAGEKLSCDAGLVTVLTVPESSELSCPPESSAWAQTASFLHLTSISHWYRASQKGRDLGQGSSLKLRQP